HELPTVARVARGAGARVAGPLQAGLVVAGGDGHGRSVPLAGAPCFGYHRNMPDMPDLAAVAALVSDPTRGRMLTALMDGRARTATELALAGDVAAPTASSHLARLTGAGLLTIARQGRHRYFRIATPEVAASLEGLM